MPATKRGIYHNLKESKYTISNGEVVFFFSSKYYVRKFMERYKKNRENVKYKRIEEESPINLSTLADISLYKQIEKRGVRSMLEGDELGWEDDISYALRGMTDKKSYEWIRIAATRVGERFGKHETTQKTNKEPLSQVPICCSRKSTRNIS